MTLNLAWPKYNRCCHLLVFVTHYWISYYMFQRTLQVFFVREIQTLDWGQMVVLRQRLVLWNWRFINRYYHKTNSDKTFAIESFVTGLILWNSFIICLVSLYRRSMIRMYEIELYLAWWTTHLLFETFSVNVSFDTQYRVYI